MDLKSGYYYHIYNRGNNSQKIFFKRENYLFFLEKMKKHLSPYASIIAWCLMPNHFHWVIYIKKEILNTSNIQDEVTLKSQKINQSIGILLSSYTRAIQKQEGITGSLFQKRTKAKPLIDEIEFEKAYWQTTFGTQINISEGKSYLETCVAYVHLNPVFTGIANESADWEFSSYRDYVGSREGKLIDYELIKREGLFPSESRHPSSSRETTNCVIIGIGSNLDAEKNISTMLDILQQKVNVIKVSPLVKTKPIGIQNQPDFTNGAVKIKTEFNRQDLNGMLKDIEDQMGRDRSVPKFGPRNIDLDIVVWNGEIVDQDYYTRDFLRKSVKEVW